jgi:hypothetical protein
MLKLWNYFRLWMLKNYSKSQCYVQPCLSKNPKYTFYTIKSSLTLAYYFGQDEDEMKLCLMILSVPVNFWDFVRNDSSIEWD